MEISNVKNSECVMSSLSEKNLYARKITWNTNTTVQSCSTLCAAYNLLLYTCLFRTKKAYSKRAVGTAHLLFARKNTHENGLLI